MKKGIAALVFLGLCQMAVFGQDAAPTLKWKGLLAAGTITTLNDAGTYTQLWQKKTKVAGGSLELAGTYGTETSGLSFTYRYQNLTAGTTVVNNIEGAYAWAQIPGLPAAKVLVGNINDTTFDAIDDEGDALVRGNGVQVQYAVAPGLKVGAMVDVKNLAKSIGTATVDPVYLFGASYSLDKVADFAFAAKSGPDDVNGNKAIFHDASASVSLNAVENLWFVLGYNRNVQAQGDVNFDAASKDAPVQQLIDVDAAYPITDALSVGFTSYVYLWSSNILTWDTSKAAGPSYTLSPNVSFALTPQIKLGATVNYGNGWQMEKLTDLSFDPNITVKVDKNCKILAHYVYDTQSGDSKPKANATSQTLRAEIQYKF